MKGKKRVMNLNSLSTWKGVIKMDLAVRVRHIARQQLLRRAIAVLDLRRTVPDRMITHSSNPILPPFLLSLALSLLTPSPLSSSLRYK